MPSKRFRLIMVFAASLILAAPAFAAEQRHQFLEPIQPDHPRKEKAAGPTPTDKLCYCRTVHERNAAGRLTWKVICTEDRPEHGARKIRAADCGAIRNRMRQ
jgi:hypothetical protein